MHNKTTERMIAEVGRPLKQALASLSPHSSKIRSTWHKLLKRHELCGKHSAALGGLQLAAAPVVHPTSFTRIYREACEREAEDLIHREVPAQCAALAIDLYVESCLPYLIADGLGEAQRRAFLRWTSSYRYLLLSSFTHQEMIERQSLRERTTLADRRSKEFAADLGDAYEKERRRLAQDLHDEIGHDLIVLKLYTEVIALDLKKGEIGQVRRKLKESVSLIKHALKGVRHLTFDLGPAIWNEQGFLPAVRIYVRQFAARTGLYVRFNARGLKVQLPARYETALYKALQGALSNVAAHAAARKVKITLASRKDYVVMRVEDDGKGFNVERKLSVPRHSYGLRAMRDRIELLGGTIHFVSWPVPRATEHRGTAIEFHLPWHEVKQQ